MITSNIILEYSTGILFTRQLKLHVSLFLSSSGYLLSLWESTDRVRRTSPLTQYQTLNASVLQITIRC